MLPQVAAGDTLTHSVTLSDYPASAGWVLSYRLIPRTGSAITFNAAADGDNFAVSVAAATTSAWTAGTYACKELVYSYAMWVSPRFHLEVIRAYDAMVTGQSNTVQQTDVVKWANFIADGLRLEGSARLGLFQSVTRDYAPEMVKYLPTYGIDAPRLPDGQLITSTSEASSLVTRPVTYLLKAHGVQMSAAAFNRLLVDAGLLERVTRKSSKGEDKHFMSVTHDGERYGKNVTAPQNQRETQPHWYESRFGDLLKRVGVVERD
jgi:hypothetical protein